MARFHDINHMTNTPVSALMRHRLAAPLLLTSAIIIAYANSFPGIFIQDDIYIVRDNPLVANLDLWKILRSEYWAGIESNGLYRPLTILSLALNRLLLGPAPLGFHLVNVLLHAGVVILLWRLLLRWEIPQLVAFLAALLFAVHPIHAEVINIVVGRSELLAALFLLLALVFASDNGRRAAVLTGLCYLAALLSKEHAVTLLLLLPIRDGFVTDSMRSLRVRLPLYLTLLGMTLVWLAWRWLGVIHEFPATVPPPEVLPLATLSWDGRFLSALLLQGVYLSKLLIPVNLQAVYDGSDLPRLITTMVSLRGVLVLVGGIGTLVLVVHGWRHRQLLGLFAALYLASFLLTANLFFPIGVTFAERLAYFPSLWFCAGAAVLIGSLYEIRRYQPVAWGVTIGSFALLTALSVVRNPDFSSEARYWETDVRRNPDDLLALIKHAELLATAGRYPEAEETFRKVLRLSPTFAYGHRSYVNYLIFKRRFDEALSVSQQSLAIARDRADRTAMAYDLGDQARIHLHLGEPAQALALLDESAGILGRSDFDAELRGQVLASLGRHEEAARSFAHGNNPVATAGASYDQAVMLFKQGRLTEARARLEQLTRQEGANAESWNLLGAACGQLGDWPAAIAAFEQAIRLAPDNRFYAENLQAAREQRRE